MKNFQKYEQHSTKSVDEKHRDPSQDLQKKDLEVGELFVISLLCAHKSDCGQKYGR